MVGQASVLSYFWQAGIIVKAVMLILVMASLAWSIKAWAALTLPIHPRWRERHINEQRQLLRMEFRKFLAVFINVPCQILNTGRRLVYRLLTWNPWQHVFFRFADST